MANTPPPASSDDGAGSEFLPPPEFIPHVRTPGWVAFAPLSPQAHAVAQFLYGHVNPDDGTFLVIPSQATVARFLGAKTENSARRYVNELKDAGVLASVLTFWDRRARRRTTRRVRDDGVNNDQTSNTYQLAWNPPRGRQHPGPLNSSEWHHPEKIQQRIMSEQARYQAHHPTPPQHSEGGSDQQKQEFSQVAPPLNTVEGPPSTHEGGPPHSVEDEEEQGEKNKTIHPPGEVDLAGDADHASPISTNHASAEGGADGWMEDGSAEPETTDTTSPGAVLVGRLERRHSAQLHAHRNAHIATVDAAIAALGESQVSSSLGDGLDQANSPSGALVQRIRALPGKVATQQAQDADRAEREQRVDAAAERNQTQPTGQSNQKQETPDQLLKTLGGDGAFVPSRFRNTAGDAA